MKKILYYVTDHGRGHATRTVAITRELKKLDVEITIRNSNQFEFFNKSLPNIKILSGQTDVGPIIKKNGISIDREQSISLLNNWIDNLENISLNEFESVSKYHPDLIISDISPMPFLVAKKMKIPSIAISNFSWYDVLDFLSDQKLEKLDEAYSEASYVIKLPLSTPLEHFKNSKDVGFVSRKPIKKDFEIRKQLNIKDSEKLVFLALGDSEDVFDINFDKEMKVVSTGTKIKKCDDLISLPNYVEGQDLVAASDLVIAKCGYGVISESLNSNTPFVYVFDEFHKEQNTMHNSLCNLGLQNNIGFDELQNIVFDHDFIKKTRSLPKKKIDTSNVVNFLQEELFR